MKPQSQDRKDRLAAALRENLKRRKARAKAIGLTLKAGHETPEADALPAPASRQKSAPKRN